MTDRTIRIAPSVLAADFLHLEDAIRQAEEAGVDRLHLDVMDGRFVPNISFGLPIVECIRSATPLRLETHLMIVEPERYVDAFARAGADTITIHAEVSPHLYRTVQHIHDVGRLAGVAINPGTPWTAVEEVLGITDLILVMTVNPGFGGQEFIEPMLAKVERVRAAIDRLSLSTELEVDGGITVDTAAAVVAAGARVLVAGTSVYREPEGVGESVRRLLASAEM